MMPQLNLPRGYRLEPPLCNFFFLSFGIFSYIISLQYSQPSFIDRNDKNFNWSRRVKIKMVRFTYPEFQTNLIWKKIKINFYNILNIKNNL